MGASMIRDLAAAIIRDGKVPSRAEFHCLPLQGKGVCTGYGQLPWAQADRAGHESPGEDCGWPHQTVGVNQQFQFGFVPDRGTTDAIFVVRQLQENYLAAKKRLYMAFIELEKMFDRVP